MSVSQELLNISAKLSQLGFTVQSADTRITIRLPLYCSVRISYEGQNLRMEPRFGYTHRSVESWIGFALFAVIWLGYRFTAMGSSITIASLIWIGFLLVFYIVWDINRYIITESAIAQIRQLINQRHDGFSLATAR
jgi:hypothetical protein